MSLDDQHEALCAQGEQNVEPAEPIGLGHEVDQGLVSAVGEGLEVDEPGLAETIEVVLGAPARRRGGTRCRTRDGETVVFAASSGIDSAAEHDTLDDLKQAIVESRSDPGIMHQLPHFAALVHAAFNEGHVQGKVSVDAWALASERDGLAVATAIAIDLAPDELAARLDQNEARRRFDAAVFSNGVTSSVSEDAEFSRAVGLGAGDAAIWQDAIQLLCLVETPDAPPDALMDVHHVEEGDAENCVPELELAHPLGRYLHIGFSNTSATGDQMRRLLRLVPIAIKTQSIWFTQRELRARILATDFEAAQQGRQEITDLLLRLQQLRFELHLWGSEIEAYRNALVPWQARVLVRYNTSWGMEDAYARLVCLVDHACELLGATAERFDRVVEAGAVAGYFDLANLSNINLQPLAHSPVFTILVAFFPAITGIAILSLIVAARRRR